MSDRLLAKRIRLSMYKQHFGLSQQPFSIAPNPHFLYMSPQHSEALGHLLYGVRTGDGFVQLTGEVGTGKTTLCRGLIEQLPEEVDVALILNPRVTALELIASLCDELHVSYPKDTTSIKVLIDALNTYLLDAHARGRRTVLIIDEAQCLGADALEQVRLLTNLETINAKLLQIMLVGQPELRDLLARDNLRQLAQRITARYHLMPISRRETAAYIRHRLQLAEARSDVFDERAIELVHDLTQGVPRLINVLCDRAMLGAYTEGKHQIDRRIVRKAAGETLVQASAPSAAGHNWQRRLAFTLPLLLVMGIWVWLTFKPTGVPEAATATKASAQPVDVVSTKPQTVDQPTVPETRPEPPAAVQPEPVVTVEPPVEVAAPLPVSEPAPARPSLAEWLSAIAAKPKPVSAWNTLYREWGYDSPAASKQQACKQAVRAGLACLSGSGSFGLLSRLDRPAVLKLRTDDGRMLEVLLRSIEGDQLELVADDAPIRVLKSEVEPRWYGNYVLLWKKPPAGSAQLRLRMRGPDVNWLREQVTKISDDPLTSGKPQLFNRSLADAVAGIQRQNALQPDGVAGPRTLILLNNLTSAPAIPHLSEITPGAAE